MKTIGGIPCTNVRVEDNTPNAARLFAWLRYHRPFSVSKAIEEASAEVTPKAKECDCCGKPLNGEGYAYCQTCLLDGGE